MSEPSPFGVIAAAGTLRARQAGQDAVVLAHTWTDDGVLAAPAGNGAQLLHLSVALCVLNDTYREAGRLEVAVDGVAVRADGGFADDWSSTGITYDVEVDTPASEQDLARLLAAVDQVAEVPRVLRAGADVRRSGA